MKSTELSKTKTEKFEIKIKPLNKTYCVFFAKKTVTIDGEDFIYTSEGVGKTNVINESYDNDILPKNITECIYSNPEFLELIRTKGSPSTYTEDSLDDFDYTLTQLKKLYKKNKVTYDEVNENTIDKLILVDHATETVYKLKDNTILNTALFASSLNLDESRFNKYNDHIKRLKKEKRLDSDAKLEYLLDRLHNSLLECLNARIVFSNDEFEQIIKSNDKHIKHIEYFKIKKAIDDLDILGMSKDLKSEAEIKIDENRDMENQPQYY